MENLENYSSEPQENKSIYERITGSIVLKFAVIFFLTLILLIPMNLIDDLIHERKAREQGVSNEIAAKWGREQVIASPIIAVPYEEVKESFQPSGKGVKELVTSVETQWAYLLPNETQVSAEVKPEPLKRGIYQAIVYQTNISMKGNFQGFDLSKLEVAPERLQWGKAKLIYGVQDMKGLSANPKLSWADSSYELSKANLDINPFLFNLAADLNLKGNEDLNRTFAISYEIRGSKSLNFLPLAKQSNIQVKGEWSNPSFNGAYLPESREVGERAFTASWELPSFNRKLPQQWTGDDTQVYTFSGIDLQSAESGEYYTTAVTQPVEPQSVGAGGASLSSDYDMVQINFLPSINNYQKTNRVTKYGILVVALTFVSLLFMEVIKKQRVHIIQYVLIGFAMVLFYALLLAISEHLGFNLAYLLAALATTGLIASFVKAITKNSQSALIFAAILSLFYSFIYILMQLRDYSLIVGTIGVFIILAVLMRLSTKIDWYQFDRR